MPLRFDATASTIVIETFAEGLLSAFAHDMRLEARGGTGESESDARIEVSFPVRQITAVESSKKGKRDYHRLSASDATDVENRVRTQVFPGLDAVRIEAEREGAVVYVMAQKRTRAAIRLKVREEEGAVIAEGEGTLSMESIGAGKVKVPMGALKLRDEVTVRVKARFVPFS